MTLELRKPVRIGRDGAEVVYTEIKLREPTCGELARASKEASNIEAAIALISQVAGIPRSAVEKMSKRDFLEADRFLEGFGLPPATPGK